MISYDNVTKQNIKSHNPNWSRILDYSYRILTIGGSRSGKTNPLLNLIKQQADDSYDIIDKIYLCSKAFIEYSNNMEDVHENIEEYNPARECNVLIIFGDMIADMISNKKRNQTVAELFIRGRQLNISTTFITQFYFAASKDVRLNCTHFSVIKIPNKQELQQIASVIDIHQ